MDFVLTLCAFSVERGNLVALRVDVNADADHPASNNSGALNVAWVCLKTGYAKIQ
jgi:hypothetical protein